MIDRPRFLAGDTRYFEQLLREFGPLTRDVAERHSATSDEADELFQEIWIRVWRRRETYDGGDFRTWLLVIGRNLARDRHRRAAAYGRFVDHLRVFERPEEPASPLDRTVEAERRASVRNAVGTLSGRSREALTHRLSGAHSTSEIAAMMGISPATVRSLISKGLAKISAELERIA